MVSEEQLQLLNIDKLSLCYEIHGQPAKWFSLVTDECASVNAHYSALTQHLTVINKIGVRAVDNNDQCVNIKVDVDQCKTSVNNVYLTQMERYSFGGINIRRYRNRARISVPNCADVTLVMWVICEEQILMDHYYPGGSIKAHIIKFVVMRGLNFGHREAHGFLGRVT